MQLFALLKLENSLARWPWVATLLGVIIVKLTKL